MKISNSKERIQELMSYFGINQTELCKRTGLQKSALSNYLNGDREPRQDQISLIADPFNVNPAWLMGYDVSMFMEPAATSSPAAPANSLRKDEQDLLLEYNSLNSEGKKEIMRYLDYARSIDEYKNIARN